MANILCDIAIIGAGLAGLAAGEYLDNHGYNIKIIETEDPVGGSVATHHLPDGTHFEQGAFSFGNGEQPLWDYIQRFSLPLIQQTGMEQLYVFKNHSGMMHEKGTFLAGNEREIVLGQLMGYFLSRLEKIENDIPLAQALQSVGASPEAIAWLQANTILGLLGNGFGTLSTKATLDFLKQYDTSTVFYALQGGNDQLPKALALQLKDHILLSHRVQKVEQLQDMCLLQGDNFVIQAKKVIFAIPLPALNKIEISPALSPKKQLAMKNVLYTNCARISLIAPPNIFGRLPGGGIFLVSDELGCFREQSLFQRDPGKKTVINASVVGEKADHLSSSGERWKSLINDTLCTFFPNWDPRQVQYYVHVCKEGYSSFTPESYEQQCYLKESEGRFYFAGEHTSKLFASMNGALESGIRVAQEILRSDKKSVIHYDQ